jgi:hypothetical protein
VEKKRKKGREILTCSHRLGAFGISFGLPVLVYLFTFSCNDISGCPAPSFLSPKTLSIDQLKVEVGWPEDGILGLASRKASGALAAYYLLNLILYAILPAAEVEGTELRSGGRLKYRFNSTSYGKKQLHVIRIYGLSC